MIIGVERTQLQIWSAARCCQQYSGPMQTFDPEQSLLLQLQGPVLRHALQKLDREDIACLAVTCSRLSHAAAASYTSVSVPYSPEPKPADVVQWQDTFGASVTQCSFSGPRVGPFEVLDWPEWQHMSNPPWPQLIVLYLKYVQLQLHPADGRQGVLHACTNLRVLKLQECSVQDAAAAFAALAALPSLRSLTLDNVCDQADRAMLGDLQLLKQLTKLHFARCARSLKQAAPTQHSSQLRQLSALVNLQDLDLSGLAAGGLPGGVPSQLQKLTRLQLHYRCPGEVDPTEQFQHLSNLTALRDLALQCYDTLFSAADVSGIQSLTQLTSLKLTCRSLAFRAACIDSWAHSLTALQRLSLYKCKVQADALAAFTQLRALSLEEVITQVSLEELLLAVSKLPQVTELWYGTSDDCVPDEAWTEYLRPPQTAGTPLTALIVSTNLCSLHLGLMGYDVNSKCHLLHHGGVYPHLRKIEFDHPCSAFDGMDIDEQQLQQLCSCCPAVESLSLVGASYLPPSAFIPLLQLSALTFLRLTELYEEPSGAVSVVAQLTGLKYLDLQELLQLPHPALMQFTALTALEELHLDGQEGWGVSWTLTLKNEARWRNPPDVYLQLQRRLLDETASRHAVERSTEATSAASDDSDDMTTPFQQSLQLR